MILSVAGGQVFAEQLRIYISADLEGIGGVVSSTQASRGQPEYEQFRALMTAEVNAAIEGALAAGATQILVSDSHGRGENLLVQQLNPAARLVRSFPRPLDMMEGIDGSFDAVLLIGYHASANASDAVLPHTMAKRIASIRLNGRNVSEGGINAAVAGHFGVPVVLVSGDRSTIEEMRALMGDVRGAEVKVAHGSNSATTLHPSVSQALIRDRTREALTDLSRHRPQPYRVKSPVELEMSFVSNADAEILSWLPQVERISGNTIRIRLPDMVAVAKFINAAMFINGASIA